MIALEGVGKSFGAVRALEGITLTVAEGEFVSLVGPSGCGKTTLLRMICGLIAPDEGSIRVQGQPPRPSADMAMVFQSARLLPWRTVAGNIEFVLGLKGLSRAEAHTRALALLGAVGLRDFAEAFPHQLSGGMQSRVGLARALAVEPGVLLMDEPFAALDAMTRETLRAELLRLWTRRRMAVVFVTHDIDEAVLLSQRIVLLRPRPGRIDRVLPIALPQGQDPRGTPEFAAARGELWQRIHAMAADGAPLEELARAFPEGR